MRSIMEWADLEFFFNEVLDFTLFQINQKPVTVFNILIFLFVISGFILLSVIIRNALNRKILKHFKVDEGTGYTLSRITQYIVAVLGALISFQIVGIDLSGLAVIFGFLSVGIGFGLQNITSNFISGLIILFERPISVGDRVTVSNIEGDITEINIRATKVRTVNNISIIVPNSEFVSKDVINYSHGDPSYRLDIDVGVAYGSDLEKVLSAMKEVADENKAVINSPKAEVHLIEFGDSAWKMQLRAWIANVKEYPKIRNELNKAIVRKFRDRGIVIPFPQRDLHLRSTVSLLSDHQKETDT